MSSFSLLIHQPSIIHQSFIIMSNSNKVTIEELIAQGQFDEVTHDPELDICKAKITLPTGVTTGGRIQLILPSDGYVWPSHLVQQPGRGVRQSDHSQI